ncbi:DNA recombination-mediator protein A [Peptoclostridium litorale DSM 5388]|uniref:Protein Smf n=1 Tax=Peptoclostridium litorale DSM 5388 TaxID=1121324 RepID=A0A069RGL1_PEPLI|nr:DNA-processing protein DprA [Peptoclostridium litorale]KDR95943.1 protein Smf [Peptoclostridium litorale DSM 5388]SIO09499.1 DNA recombination-mediator protein A [Peptoclostridium litorale DSM 5388]
MELYLIALKELGLDNMTLNYIALNCTFEEVHEIFSGHYLSIQLSKNINLDKYSSKLSDLVLMQEYLKKAKNIIKKNKKNKIKFVCIHQKSYPQNLKKLADAPTILYFKGRGFYKKHIKALACVGTRTPTPFGVSAVESLIPKWVNEDFTIVSGLAEGIDTVSHTTCLKNNGTTIAVLAHGLDMIYPKSNKDLADTILQSNGLLVSEYPIGTPPEKHHFVNRNRIVSGLSKGVVVFETKAKSGSMHTVNFAISQERPVFCPLPDMAKPQTEGLLKLLNEKKAVAIQGKNRYEKAIILTGYKVKKDKAKIQQLKTISTYNILNTLDPDINKIHESKISEKKTATITVDRELYEKYKQILNKQNLSSKDLFNAFILSVINSQKT